MVRLEPVDEARYRGIVARLAAAVERSLLDTVIANRVVAAPLVLEDWRVARARWRHAVQPSGACGLRVHLDVAACYDSIRPEVVAASLRAAGADPRPVVRFLHELADHGVPGLPVGPEPSAVLANAVLARVDLAVAGAGAPFVRWVDDVVAFVPDRRRAVRVTDAVRRELDALGLRTNEAKTRVEDRRTHVSGGTSGERSPAAQAVAASVR
jgi:hypothetical protein